ncbi:fatty acid desaturase [Hyphococcus formosus]|uniref:fatty acid desaturase n=1 Tax=Hyphococcus formosus TaxID=3143534 RepID=UPI00398AA19A
MSESSITGFAPTRPSSLTRGAAWPTVGLFASLWIGISLSAWAALSGVIPFWVACLINAVFLYVTAHTNHEAIHRNISAGAPKLRWLNEAIGHFGSFWFFLPFLAFKAVHLAHHRAPNNPDEDGDMWVARKNPFVVFICCASILVGYERQIWRLARTGGLSRRAVISIYGQRLLAIAIVATAVSIGYGYEIMMLWVIPGLLTVPFLAYFFAYVVHHPHTETEAYQASNVLLTTPRLQPLMTAIFVFQNYHLVHHLNPRIPFYEYGKVFRQMRSELEEKEAAIRGIKQ